MTETSLLIRQRPDVWSAGLALASSLTGITYAPKLSLADGTIYACGAYHPYKPPTPKTNVELDREIEEQWERLKKERARIPDGKTPHERNLNRDTARATKEYLRKLLQERDQRRGKPSTVARFSVPVPVGAMEWLLHEAGHHVAASHGERLLPNYGLSESEHGHDGEREWQAWAFEEIVLAPFGSSRLFAPPSQRDGAAYAKTGPMPIACLRHVEKEIVALGLDVEQWRQVWGEWVRWGLTLGDAAPWRSTN